MTDKTVKSIVELRLSVPALKALIEHWLDEAGACLPERLYGVLSDFCLFELSDEGEIEAFDLLVRLILRADRLPVKLLAEFLSVFDEDAEELPDRLTVANAAFVIKGSLEREQMLRNLEKIKVS